MASSGKEIIIINGYRWENVTNKTAVGSVYSLKDVIACNGRVPNYISNN